MTKKKDIFIYSLYDKEKDIFIKKNYETEFLALQEPMITKFKIKKPFWYHEKILGAERILCDYYANCLSYDYQDKTYSFYVIGLYKLMLLRLGLDADNNIIEKKHKLYPVFKEIRAAFNKKPKKNFWSDTYLKKELFIEYHLANIFKKNKTLFEKAKKVVDFVFEDWKTYTLVQSMTIHKELFKDTEGKKPYDWDILKDYLPGPEQVLAMSMIKNIRMLWYGALNPVAFYKEIEIKENTNLSKYGRPGVTWNFAYFKKSAYELVDFDDQKISFINVWHDITESLKDVIKELNQKNFISFDGHGWVLSFHPYLIHLQENVAKTCGQKCDIDLLKDLKIAGIESYLSQYLPTFYKKQEGAILPDFYDMTSKKEDHEGE